MNGKFWTISALMLMAFLLVGGPAMASFAGPGDIPHYDCPDEDGDESCGNPPTD